MDIIKLRSTNTDGLAVRRKGVGFVGIGWNWNAFAIGGEIFSHEDDARGLGIFLGPFVLVAGLFKKWSEQRYG